MGFASLHGLTLVTRRIASAVGIARHFAASLALALALLAGPALALDPDRSIAQYEHTRWGRSQGAPSGINNIAQTRDGYLWLSSDDGLFRFDGLRFERIDPHVDIAAHGPPFALLATLSGDLWAYYPGSKRFAVYRAGRFRTVSAPMIEGTVADLAQTPNGDIWVAGGRVGQPMLRYRNGTWTQMQPSERHGRDINMGMVVTADGALWVAYSSNIFRLPPGGDTFQHMINDPGARMRLSIDPQGRVWVTGAGSSRPLTGPRGRWTGPPARGRHPSDNYSRRGWPMFDRHGNLWIARRKDGLERLRLPSAAGPADTGAQFTEFLASDGLSSDATKAIFEDREGTIWAGTTLGLDRFRDADVVVEPRLNRTAAFGDILLSDAQGNVFIAQRSTVYRVRPRGRPEPVLTGVNEPEAMCEGRNGSIWIMLADRIAVLRDGGHTRIAKPDGLESGINGCGLDRWGRFWLSAGESGMFRRTGAGWTHVPTAAPRRFRAGQMLTDRSGDLWVSGSAGMIARVGGDRLAVLDFRPHGVLGEIRTMASSKDGLLVISSDAIVRVERGRLFVVKGDRIGTLFFANGLVQTPVGETWIFDRNGITRLRTADLERAFTDRRFRVSGRTFDSLDGLVDSNAVRTLQTLVRGGDGRLWASTATGTVWMDPAKLTFNRLPPMVAISSIEFNGRRLFDPRTLRLPAGSSNLMIGFSALSLRIPERVKVRYRLEGQDERWINPGARRQAFYTNLGPGNYRFRVIAANENGVWNNTGATLRFSIAPTFVQSIWFKLLLAGLVIAVLAAAYAFRLRQVTARLKSFFDIRIAERERIARELHDTLLQGFQGLLLQFKAVANSLPDGNEPRRKLDRSLERAQQVLIEGRDRVKELRAQPDEGDFAETLLEHASAQVHAQPPRLHLTQEGAARPLHPLVNEELLRIVEEAVRNAVAHAEPSTVEILLLWSWRGLRLAVRDDGIGMPASILMNGSRAGHFGLMGMRERAERIGGRFAVTSREGAGTEVALEVPAHTAYRHHPSRLFDRLRLRFARTLEYSA